MGNLITLLAILTVGALTTLALYLGLDGALFMSAITIIGGLGGYHIAKRHYNKKSKSKD